MLQCSISFRSNDKVVIIVARTGPTLMCLSGMSTFVVLLSICIWRSIVSPVLTKEELSQFVKPLGVEFPRIVCLANNE